MVCGEFGVVVLSGLGSSFCWSNFFSFLFFSVSQQTPLFSVFGALSEIQHS